MLELKGELVFKTVAYHRAADAIGRSPVDLVSAYRAGNPPTVPGVGKAISDKIRELVTTGHMAVYDRLRAEVPPTLVEILEIPGLGPKTVRQLNTELGIETIEDLRRAAEEGRLRTVRGMSARTEALVLEGIARLEVRFERMRLDQAEDLSQRVHRRPRRDARGPLAGARRLVPPQEGIDRRPRHPRRDRPADGAHRRVHAVRHGRLGHQQGRLQGGRPDHARPAGGPDGHAAGRGRDLPDPLHRVEGAQRPPPGDGPRPGLEPVGEGLPAHRRGRRAPDR